MNSRYNFVLRKDKEKNDMNIIGHVYTDFQEKFGIPRQSGLVDELTGTVVFLPEYRQPEAFRGLEDFSHIWILWEFHKAKRENWSATVKPPKLGGNKRMGVFATRSPFRPNNIGLSSVKLTGIEYTDDYGPILHISGVDLLNGTPVYDIKPYIPYTDCHLDATGRFYRTPSYGKTGCHLSAGASGNDPGSQASCLDRHSCRRSASRLPA